MFQFVLFLIAVYSPANQLDINRATREEIRQLPVDSVVAERIYQHLYEYGRFNSIYELSGIKGVGPALLERLKPMVYVSLRRADEDRLRKMHLVQRRLASEEGPTRAAVEEWQDMLLTPLNINRASVDDLVMLDNVSLVDAVAVAKYLKSGRTIRSRYDLAKRIVGLSSYGYRNIRDFVAYQDMKFEGFGGNYRLNYLSCPAWETEVSTVDFSQALDALEKDTAEFRAAGFTKNEIEYIRHRLEAEKDYLEEGGSSGGVRNRLRIRLGNHFRTGAWVNQKFFEPGAINGLKGFVSGQDFGLLRRVFLGDYRVTLGQGLLLDNTAELRARTHERPRGLFNDLDENPGFGFRGGAAEIGLSRFGLAGCISSARRDAILNPDSSVNYYIITTPCYPTFKDVLKETDIAGSGYLDLSDFLMIPVGTRLGFNALSIRYDRDFKPDARYLDLPGDGTELADPNYTRLDSGKARLFYGFDFRTVVENVSLEGELALKPDVGTSFLPKTGTQKAYLAKARAQYNYLYLTALFRHYDIGYDNPYNRGYCEQLRFEDTPFEKAYRLIDPAYSGLQDFPMPKAEQGFLVETRYQISRKITFTRAYIDVWRNLAWGMSNIRFQAEIEYRPVFPLRIRFRQKLQSKGLPKPVLSTRSNTSESSIRVMASLTNHDFLTGEVREGRVHLIPNPKYGDKASMSGNFLAVQWEHNFSDDFNTELGVATWLTRDMSQWILEDVGIDFLEGDGLRWYAALNDRISERLLIYLKCRHKVSWFPHTGLGSSEGVHYSESPFPVRDFVSKDDAFGIAIQVDVLW